MLTTEINKGEAALAVIGMKAVLSREIERITAPQKRDMNDYGRVIEKRIKELFNEEVKCTWPLPPSYKSMLKQTSEKVELSQIEQMISPLPSEVQMEFTTIAGKVYVALQALLPKRSSITLSGNTQLTIDDPTYLSFYNIFRVLDDPLQVIELASCGALLKSQCESVRSIYPTISAAIDEAIQNDVTNRKHDIPHVVEYGLSTWLNIPVFVGDYSSLYVDANKQQNKQQNPSESQLSPESATSITASESAQYPKAS